MIFKRKKDKAITEIFGAKFSAKGKQLDRMVSIIIRVARNRDLKVPELVDEFDVIIRTLYEYMKKLHKWYVIRFWSKFKVINQPFVFLNKNVYIIGVGTSL
ncbi:MAG: hypothetical protein K8R25_09785 [Methanosarcinales archaeon]|nr:hypothetical protein [Methanosarcinales archaeon]